MIVSYTVEEIGSLSLTSITKEDLTISVDAYILRNIVNKLLNWSTMRGSCRNAYRRVYIISTD